MHPSQSHPPAMTATAGDLLRGPRVRVWPTSKGSLRSNALPRGLTLVTNKLVAPQPGTYNVTFKITRKNGTSLMRAIDNKVG